MNRYCVVRLEENGEAIGIVKMPEEFHIWNAFHPYRDCPGSPKKVIYPPITESEYSSFEELKLFPVYDWYEITLQSPSKRWVSIFDPVVYERCGKVTRPRR